MTATIRTRATKAQVMSALNEIPKIVAGKTSDAKGLKEHFYGVYARHLFRKIHKAFLAKSKGGSDELGNSWKPLTDTTIRRRTTSRSRKLALSRRSDIRSRVPILIDTKRLIKSLTPGRVSESGYSASKEQIYKTASRSFEIGTEVPYSGMQHKERPLWPDDMGPWHQEALIKARDVLAKKIVKELRGP